MSEGQVAAFLQSPPHLGNQVAEDPLLASLLERLVPADAPHREEALQDLESFGWEAATTVKELGQQAEREPPSLVQFDAWGRRVDRVLTSPAWRELKAVSAREGLVAAAYERREGQHSRVLQVAKLVLFGASSGLFNCPLAMTDGAARLCEALLTAGRQLEAATGQGLPSEMRAVLEGAFGHLTSRDPATFWTSGQWMTEKGGGSDVRRGTETVAEPEAAGRTGVGAWYRLQGYKWFTSAADGEVSMALAREQPDGPGGNGQGLTLFYVPVLRDADGCPQGFQVVRLKDKLGTRQLPTAELQLDGMRALKISDTGRGVAAISLMVNITRLHNAAAATSHMTRIAALAQDYARRRRAFGALLIEQPLAQRTLGWLRLHAAGSLALTLEVARLLGLQECGAATPGDAHMLRLLTPLAKLFTAKEAVAVVSEGIEFFGGQGYIESTHLPVILRDAQVLPIWEGTTSVLSLDVLRVLGGSPRAASTFAQQCEARLAAAAAAAAGGCAAGSCGSERGGSSGTAVAAPGQEEGGDESPSASLQRACTALQGRLPAVAARLQAAAAAGPSSQAAQLGARQLAFDLSRLFVGVLLAEHAAWSGEAAHALMAAEWSQEVLVMVPGAAAEAGVEGKQQAQLRAARILSGADEPLPQPRARY